jgi:CRISPR-associated protein Csd1
MILQSLYALAQSEHLMNDPDFQWKPVAWLVTVGEQGKYLGIVGTHYMPPAQGKRPPKPIPKDMRVPYQIGRSGVKAPSLFLVDNAKYVFGLPTKDKNFSFEEGRQKSSEFRKSVLKCADETHDPGILAVLQLLDDIAEQRISIQLPEECLSNEQFAFIYEPDVDLLVHERPAIENYWRKMRSQDTSDKKSKFICLVSGQKVNDPGLFPKIKKIPGGSTAGVGLVSFNKNAFESYGLDGNENAPISRFAAESCATALNRLLDPAFPDPNQAGQKMPSRCYKLNSDTVVCYWATQNEAQDFCNQFAPIMEVRPEDVEALYHSIWRGKTPPDLDVSAFYVLTLSGTQGRAVIRDWFESTVYKVATNIARYFKDLDLVRNTPKPKERDLPPQIPMTVLLRSLAVRGELDSIPSCLAAQMSRAALSGCRYPQTLLPRALERMRAEIGDAEWAGLERRDARAALIKAVLIRNFKKEVDREMNPNSDSQGYNLGRLMAVLERLQLEALGDVNANVIDRFFSGASAAPKSVFVRLLKNARHHVRKAKDDSEKAGTVFLLDKLLDELILPFDPIQNSFPAYLSPEEQGLFIMGYHHMRYWLWMNKEERRQWEKDHPTAPRTYMWSKPENNVTLP